VQCHSTIERGITFTAQGSSYAAQQRNMFLLCSAAGTYIENVKQCIVAYMGSLALYSKVGNLPSSAKLEGGSREEKRSSV